MPSPDEDFDTGKSLPGKTDSRRLADAAEKIATALEAIAQHLAPVIVQRHTDGPLQVGDYVFDKMSDGKEDTGRISAINGSMVQIHWAGMTTPGETWWPLADFERVHK